MTTTDNADQVPVPAKDLIDFPEHGSTVEYHAGYHLLRAVGMLKGWLDDTLWSDPGFSRPRIQHLHLVLTSVELARLWVGVRDKEDPQDIADWMALMEDPDYYQEWLAAEVLALGYSWEQIAPYGGDDR